MAVVRPTPVPAQAGRRAARSGLEGDRNLRVGHAGTARRPAAACWNSCLDDQSELSLGVALDIGTTSNVVYLVDLLSGQVLARAVDYNGQITAART